MLETIGVRRPYESSSLKVHFKGDESRVLFESESKKVSSCLHLDAGRSIEDVLVKDWRLLQTNTNSNSNSFFIFQKKIVDESYKPQNTQIEFIKKNLIDLQFNFFR